MLDARCKVQGAGCKVQAPRCWGASSKAISIAVVIAHIIHAFLMKHRYRYRGRPSDLIDERMHRLHPRARLVVMCFRAIFFAMQRGVLLLFKVSGIE